MDLQISVCLLFILFTGGHSLSCYNCIYPLTPCNQTTECSAENTNCFSAAGTVSNTALKFKSCAKAGCSNVSINLGIGNIYATCCNTDSCNSQDPPDLSQSALSAKKCYYCSGKNCSNTVNCSVNEDRCFKATANSDNSTYKGCASKYFCDYPNLISVVSNVTCCDGNLCNGAESITQSFLFLCCSLLSFILLH